ncbi:serine/threonine protein kinase [Novipirellula artificiosorum]|uniref:Serine/threonine-protein kinase PknB n=1 Tax=Novipirellula artificiosorum TaxID=2528016 RepID=A0A5C6DZZ5_9BACT|nr:serine/threonine-protein kinase [Novipirellula artificiosorum]TWU41021.1 Serine/threonine-protein kinase PknB [Novipirellula artificiosorum]
MNHPMPSEDDLFLIARAVADPCAREAYLKRVSGNDHPLYERLVAKLESDEEHESFPVGSPPGLEGTSATLLSEAAGDKIGPYELLQRIGEGGFGEVFMAQQTSPVRRKVALKVIKPGMDTKEVVSRFQAERQALAIMDHPNIAKVLDAGQTVTGRPYFVMELVRGVTITKYADTNNLSTDERLELFASVCRAIHHAHQKGVIHRDIKPSNVLVTLHDGKPVPKVIDFGVANAINQPLTERTMFTGYGQVIGTPQYMSPELAEASGLDVDTRSDIYSLGVLLYELLTGRTPFTLEQIRKAGLDEMRRIILELEPMRPSNAIQILDADTATCVANHRCTKPDSLTKLFRGELDWIVMKTLEKDRGRRYDSASGLADDVERHLNNETVEARPPSFG